MRYVILIILLLPVLSSGCVQQTGPNTNDSTEYAYNNVSGNDSFKILPKGDFTFKMLGINEFQIRPGEGTRFYVVFNNVDEDEKTHSFIARVLPSAVDFDAKAAYKCLYFTNCSQLHYDMDSWIKQTRTTMEVNYTRVGLQHMDISIPETAKKGTYMYDVVACQDLNFDQCNKSSANWGPILSLTVQVLEA
ncbi:MAG: hypothetical protein GTN76_01735 [Candidatus Aenigmarchaeota archaeon]|nr:hypothetical protein [Candidatus Aenigmarchaeota archaeon]